MAMLAAPRRKQKVINLRAKNNAWSNDSSKFGQRMLEKMGWSEGKGLGAHENGIVEHVVAKYKNDDKGLGFEDRSDQWTKHEDDFNSLLANLSNGDNNDDKLHSGVSLEVKSKKSKARVHYHKYTRGKDLTRYSEKDLANIFGKKSLKNEVKQEKVAKENMETEQATEQVFTEKGSMEDYFKNKLAALKNKNQFNISKNDDDYSDHGFKGFSACTGVDSENHQGFGFQSFQTEDCDTVMESTATEENLDSTHTESTKKKKKKKSKVQNEEVVQENIVDSEIPETVVEVTKKSKKSKKKHKDIEAEIEKPEEISVEGQDTEYVPKKKKKRKNKERGED